MTSVLQIITSYLQRANQPDILPGLKEDIKIFFHVIIHLVFIQPGVLFQNVYY